MTDNYDNYQLELFREAGAGSPRGPLRSRFFSFLRRHEKRILFFAVIALGCIICFSLGVKKGKEFSSIKKQPRFDLAVKKDKETAIVVVRPAQEKITPAKQQAPIKPGQVREPAKEKTQSGTQEEYTIQLASYKARKFADTHAGILKKRGLAPIVLQKGNYIVLCVGKFLNKDQARSSLSMLKKEYKDCCLRRL